MKISVEISYYPMLEEYVPPILSFIDRLQKQPDIQLKKTGMSTLVFGEFKTVMSIITAEIEKSFSIPNSVFILKLINYDLNTRQTKNERSL